MPLQVKVAYNGTDIFFRLSLARGKAAFTTNWDQKKMQPKVMLDPQKTGRRTSAPFDPNFAWKEGTHYRAVCCCADAVTEAQLTQYGVEAEFADEIRRQWLWTVLSGIALILDFGFALNQLLKSRQGD